MLNESWKKRVNYQAHCNTTTDAVTHLRKARSLGQAQTKAVGKFERQAW